MNDDRWIRLRALFDAARNVAQPDRSAFLDRELPDEPTLRAQVEELLAADIGAGEFLAPSREQDSAPEAVGPYRILERVGEGGFGVVYRAEQEEPLRRVVALKLIKPGMDTREVIARFETERQALAMMDHPGIARVFDAGQTDAGRPYFAMEFVDGVAITRFADEAALSTRDRIALFLEVCDAIQHAHQKGVIHRDLKPSNVLVARRDGIPTTKIIDFGIAKATGGGIGLHTLVTRRGAVIGTLGSMSPEQAGAIEAAVDTRTDIYSLGVLLYELLAGAPPFDGKRLRSMSWTDAVRVIREEDPPRLAARLLGSLDATGIASRRGADARGLARTLQGDLEWVTARALEKEPARRYASVSEFAADLRRHLATEPVLAGQPSAAYRLRKFVRRHRVGVGAAAVAVGALLAGGTAAVVGFTRAVKAEKAATREAEVARRVSDFLEGLFASSRPGASNEPPTARTLLDEGARLIHSRLHEDPRVRASLLTTMGRSYLHLGHVEEGLPLLEEALSAAETAPERDESLIRFQLSALANAILSTGSADGAEALLDRALEMAAAAGDAEPRWMAKTLYDRATLHWLSGKYQLADSILAHTLSFQDSSASIDFDVRSSIHRLVGQVALARQDLGTAIESFHRARELNDRGAREAWEEVLNTAFLASAYTSQHDADSSLKYAEEAVATAQRRFPPGHPILGLALATKGGAYSTLGDYTNAIKFSREGIDILRTTEGRRNELANELKELATLYWEIGEPDSAVAFATESVNVCISAYGEASAQVGEMLSFLAIAFLSSGRWSAAESCFVRSITTLEHIDPSSGTLAYNFMNLGELRKYQKRYAEADSLYRLSASRFDSTTSGSREGFGMCLTNRGYVNALQGRYEEAEALMQRGMAFRQGERPETSMDLGPGFVAWAAARALAGDRTGSMEKLRVAADCGATAAVAAEYPELMAMRASGDFPLPDSR